MKRHKLAWFLIVIFAAACGSHSQTAATPWQLTPGSQAIVTDSKLAAQIFRALDAAKNAGTEPNISKFPVRAATVFDWQGEERVVLGGNTEYEIPEAIHGESSLLNHVTALYGPDATRHAVRFVAFYNQKCGSSLSCGDCRDYQMAVTDYEHLLVACGQEVDHMVSVRRFMDAVVCEKDFPVAAAKEIPLPAAELDKLVKSAEEARLGGVTLFTSERHTGAAGISFSGKIYRAAGADDAAFHYRYPIGGLLQQAATERDYMIRAIVVVGEAGSWPVVNYRDRQYGYEASSFNQHEGKAPIELILSDGHGNFRLTTFEKALPYAFSTAQFMPEAVDRFLGAHLPKK